MDGDRREDAFEDIEAMTFEQAMAELESIVTRLEGGDIDLEGAIDAYARGAALKRHCEAKLRIAERRVALIDVAEDGAVGDKPLDDAGTPA